MVKMEIWANLPVKDVRRTRTFFVKLGFKVNGKFEQDNLASFIFSTGKFAINFFTEEHFSSNSGNPISDTSKGSEIVFSIGADSQGAVDKWEEKVVSAGGTVISRPHAIPEGYNFVFADPDGHRWNVFYSPSM